MLKIESNALAGIARFLGISSRGSGNATLFDDENIQSVLDVGQSVGRERMPGHGIFNIGLAHGHAGAGSMSSDLDLYAQNAGGVLSGGGISVLPDEFDIWVLNRSLWMATSILTAATAVLVPPAAHNYQLGDGNVHYQSLGHWDTVGTTGGTPAFIGKGDERVSPPMRPFRLRRGEVIRLLSTATGAGTIWSAWHVGIGPRGVPANYFAV